MPTINITILTTPDESIKNAPSFRKVQSTYPQSSGSPSYQTPNQDFNDPVIPAAEQVSLKAPVIQAPEPESIVKPAGTA